MIDYFIISDIDVFGITILVEKKIKNFEMAAINNLHRVGLISAFVTHKHITISVNNNMIIDESEIDNIIKMIKSSDLSNRKVAEMIIKGRLKGVEFPEINGSLFIF